MAGSAAVVLTVFEQISGLHTVDTREAVAKALAEPPFDGLGLSVEEVLAGARVLAMVAAACATATAILGWHVQQRSKAARVALSVLALPLFVAGMGSGGVLSSVVAVAVLMLWLQPSRDWFDGRWRPEPEQPRPAAPLHRETPRDTPASPPVQQEPPAAPQPPPYAAWPPPSQAAWPPVGTPQAPPAPFGPGAPQPQRPPAVVASVVLTWVCSLLLGGLFVIGAVWLVANPGRLMDQLTEQNPELVRQGAITTDLVRGMLIAMAAVIAVWVLAACAFAVFTLRGANWARIALLVSSGTAGVALLLCSVVNAAMVVPLAGAVAVFAMLLRRDVVAWFRGRAGR